MYLYRQKETLKGYDSYSTCISHEFLFHTLYHNTIAQSAMQGSSYIYMYMQVQLELHVVMPQKCAPCSSLHSITVFQLCRRTYS